MPPVSNYDNEINKIEQYLLESAQKAHIKIPNIKKDKHELLARTNPLENTIFVAENLLSKWQNGLVTDDEVYSVIAHEIGHRMDYKWSFTSITLRGKTLQVLYVLFLAFIFRLPLTILALIILPVLLIWILCIPWVLIKTEIPIELRADRNAVSCLITENELSNRIAKFYSFRTEHHENPLKTLCYLYNYIFTHPSINVRLKNLGYVVSLEVAKKNQSY